MGKKGQITVFIIIGIVLLIIFAIIFYVRSQAYSQQEGIESVVEAKLDVNTVKQLIQSCLDTGVELAILDNGLRGGYYDVPEKKLKAFTDWDVPLYLDETQYADDGEPSAQVLVPEIDVLEKELSKNIIRQVVPCFEDFALFNKKGYSVDAQEMTVDDSDAVSTLITNKSIRVNMPHKITLIKGEEKVTVDENYFVEKETNLGMMANTLRELLKSVDDNELLEDKLSESGLSLVGYDAEFKKLESNETLVTVSTPENFYGKPFRVMFGVAKPVPPPPREIVDLPELGEQVVRVGETLYLWVEILTAIRGTPQFTDDTDLFDINHETGEIFFVPTADQVGNYDIKIFIKTNKNEYGTIPFTLTVLPDETMQTEGVGTVHEFDA